MTTLPDFITASQVAQLLDMPNGNAFLWHRPRLEDMGFPLPLPWARNPMKWRADQVRHWIAGQGLPRAAEVVPLRVVGGNAMLLARAASR